ATCGRGVTRVDADCGFAGGGVVGDEATGAAVGAGAGATGVGAGVAAAGASGAGAGAAGAGAAGWDTGLLASGATGWTTGVGAGAASASGFSSGRANLRFLVSTTTAFVRPWLKFWRTVLCSTPDLLRVSVFLVLTP